MIGGSSIKINGKALRETAAELKSSSGRREFYRKHREIILYIVFGVLTTAISFVTYYLFRWIFPDKDSVPEWLRWIFSLTSVFGADSNTALPVILSWVCAVTFAFVTNRLFVFRSTAKGFGRVAAETLKFFAARLFTLLVDLVIMFLLVDLTGITNALYELFAKIVSNIAVLVLNYLLSKLMVFRGEKTPQGEESLTKTEEEK